MKNLKFANKVIKIMILFAFILERFIYYNDLKADENDVNDINNEIFSFYEINFTNVQLKYQNHHLFLVPNIKKVIDYYTLNNISHRENVNATDSQLNHSLMEDKKYSFENKITDIEAKVNFYFLTTYDFLLINLLFLVFIWDSRLSNLALISDTGLRLINISFIKHYELSTFYIVINSFIKKLIERDLNYSFEDMKSFLWKIKYPVMNLILFILLCYLLVLNIISSYVKFFYSKPIIMTTSEENNSKNDIRDEENIVKKVDNKSDELNINYSEVKKIETEDYKENKKSSRQRSRDTTPSKRRKPKPSNF